MTPETKAVLVARFKSLAWRVAGVAAVLLLNFIADNIGLFNLSPMIVTLIGLVVGELTKFVNSNLPVLQGRA